MTRIARRPHPTTDASPGAPVGRPVPSTHPWAWWGWALGAAVAASMSNNPLMLVLLVLAILFVVVARRTDAPWAQSVGVYLTLALVVIGFRVVLLAVMGGDREGLVLFTLPELHLPEWAAGIRMGGPVTLNAILAATYAGLRLAALVICVGAANSLANPRQALKSVPAALNQLSVAIIIALAVAPQLVESLGRIRRARRLRGGAGRGWRAVEAVLVPVLEDSLERSMQLATAMESRGYGRAVQTSSTWKGRWPTSVLLIASLCGLVWASYGLLALPELTWIPWAVMGASVVGVVGGMHLAGRHRRTTRYRPHPWRATDTAIVACGAASAALSGWLQHAHYRLVTPRVHPLEWPQLHPAMLLCAGVLVAAIALSPSPAPSRRTDQQEPR